ncbi:MAG: lysophospholipase [Deltaproteobacteria bacterium]|jgi:alpha-beta hydrolase superfamily lysophospholipase|nr:lysophospholipase [Deltaproteobacteria bacterium]
MTGTVRQLIIILCCLLLQAGCMPQFTQPHKPALAEPQLKETSFISFDGTELPLRTWQPPGGLAAAETVFIALHGFNDYSRFIYKEADFFTQHNIAVFAYDQRGFGNAPVRGRWSSNDTMGQDLKTLLHLLRQKYGNIPVYLLGHSMGAALVIQAMSGKNHPDVAGAILVAPAVWARATMPFYQKGALWLVAHTIPWYTVTGRILDRQACSDSEVLREQSRDPLIIKETRFDTIYGLQNLMDAAYASAGRFNLPTLILYGRHDEIIPPEPVLDVYNRFPGQPGSLKKLILYDNGYHMLLRGLEAEEVVGDIVAWVDEEKVKLKMEN